MWPAVVVLQDDERFRIGIRRERLCGLLEQIVGRLLFDRELIDRDNKARPRAFHIAGERRH
jgi:hypothetical protein